VANGFVWSGPRPRRFWMAIVRQRLGCCCGSTSWWMRTSVWSRRMNGLRLGLASSSVVWIGVRATRRCRRRRILRRLLVVRAARGRAGSVAASTGRRAGTGGCFRPSRSTRSLSIGPTAAGRARTFSPIASVLMSPSRLGVRWPSCRRSRSE